MSAGIKYISQHRGQTQPDKESGFKTADILHKYGGKLYGPTGNGFSALYNLSRRRAVQKRGYTNVMIHGIGTIVNVAAILLAGAAGMLLKKGIKESMGEMLVHVMGISTLFIGISGAMTGMLKAVGDGTLGTQNSMLLIISMLIGSVIGELIGIDRLLDRFGLWLKRKAHAEGEHGFVSAFVDASLVVCVGAMAIVGAIEDGIGGDPSMLFAKSALDAVIITTFTARYGRGAVFSAIPVAVLQGGVTLLSGVIAPVLSDAVISTISFVGSVMIFCVGANLCLDRKFRVANMLPALLIAAAAVGIWG